MTTDPTIPAPSALGAAVITQAAFRARRVYPGPVGLLVCRELLAWADFGHRLGKDALVRQLVAEILETGLTGRAGVDDA
jgi:hypothetical protein